MRVRIRDQLLLTMFILFVAIVTVFARSDSDPCLDTEDVDISKLKMPEKYANLTPPWIRADGTAAKVTKSNGLSYHWIWMKSLAVTGLSKLVDDVITFLSDNNCYFVPVGPSVRSAILKEKTVYLSGEVSCELHELYGKCISKFGSSGCSLYPLEDGGWGAFRLEIGDASSNRSTYKIKAEPIVLHEWRSLIGAPSGHWRFTVDTLAIFDDGIGHAYVIDPTHQGYHHLCDKKLALPTDDWADWSHNQPLKVLGFYELRTAGFSAKNESLQRYINEEVKMIDKRDAQKFYCENVMNGVVDFARQTPICHTRFLDRDDQNWISAVRWTMIDELGENWNSTIGNAVDKLQTVFSTDHKLVDIRHRLLHRVPSSDASLFITQEPSIIEDGKPMIKVHSRPILDMTTKPPQEDPKPNEDDDSEEYAVPYRVEIARPVERENEYNQHNAMNVGLPVMKFDKVEENELDDVAAYALGSTTSRKK
uniref:ULP_PROTEASE domain-containing protein n=1 Tax=Caenorhabditis tropicalis TaxID=1561998 RepID=A0A1I7TSF5_9PELO